jgi:phospholipid/cholesterol/gamma-HCH transport system substrate-binding protein
VETKANYVLIGAFTLAVTIFGLLFALWAANYSSEKNFRNYRVVFNEPVTGLSRGGSVRYNGITVGTVQELRLAPDDPRQVIAQVRLQADTPVKVDTRAKLSQDGLTGSAFIQLTGGSPGSPALGAKDPHDLPVIQTEPSALQNIADIASKLVTRMDQMLSDQNIALISKSLANIETMTGAVANQKQDLGALIVNAREASDSLKLTLDNANGTLGRLDANLVRELPGLMAKLDRGLTQLESASVNANALIAENRAPLASFTGDGLQQLGPTLDELRVLIRDLRRVAGRLDDNPAGYVLGRQQPKEFEPK